MTAYLKTIHHKLMKHKLYPKIIKQLKKLKRILLNYRSYAQSNQFNNLSNKLK